MPVPWCSRCVLLSLGLVFLPGCTPSASPVGLTAAIDNILFTYFGCVWFSDSAEQLGLRDVHLDGASLLNSEVSVVGEIEVIGRLGTYVVISESQVRMLVDFSRLVGGFNSDSFQRGTSIHVRGRVQSDAKGHIFLVANGVRRG